MEEHLEEVVYDLARKYFTRLERLARDNRSGLLSPFVSDEKSFVTLKMLSLL
jgi:hypothetical protein